MAAATPERGDASRPVVSPSGVPLVRRRRGRPALRHILFAFAAVRLARLSVFVLRDLPPGRCQLMMFRTIRRLMEGLSRLL